MLPDVTQVRVYVSYRFSVLRVGIEPMSDPVLDFWIELVSKCGESFSSKRVSSVSHTEDFHAGIICLPEGVFDFVIAMAPLHIYFNNINGIQLSQFDQYALWHV